MIKPTLLLALVALAATSCSLQLDSQYGLRWDRSIPVQRHHEAEPKHTETIAASTTVTNESQNTSDWTITDFDQIDETQTLDQIQLIADRPYGVKDVLTGEAQGAGDDIELSVADYMIDADQQVPFEKAVLAKFGGIILLLLGIGLLWLSFFAIVVMGAYGASLGGVLFTVLITAVGILVIILGRRLIQG